MQIESEGEQQRLFISTILVSIHGKLAQIHILDFRRFQFIERFLGVTFEL